MNEHRSWKRISNLRKYVACVASKLVLEWEALKCPKLGKREPSDSAWMGLNSSSSSDNARPKGTVVGIPVPPPFVHRRLEVVEAIYEVHSTQGGSDGSWFF